MNWFEILQERTKKEFLRTDIERLNTRMLRTSQTEGCVEIKIIPRKPPLNKKETG